MVRFCLLILSFFSVLCAFTVMNLNLYNAQTQVFRSILRTSEQIIALNPDIVTLQEVGHKGRVLEILTNLDYIGKWEAIMDCRGETAVLTQHKLISHYEHTSAGMNVIVQLTTSRLQVSVWVMHLHSASYGPENPSVKDEKSMHENEKWRIQEIVELIKHPEFVKQMRNTAEVPVILAGGFNTPSHYDWTERAKGLHGGKVLEWPVTKILKDATDFIDSFRQLHPNELHFPGYTWTVYDTNDAYQPAPKDRIDFIFYHGSLRASTSRTYSGPDTIQGGSDWQNNKWPSDHWALITNFEQACSPWGQMPTFNVPSQYNYGPFTPIGKCPFKILMSAYYEKYYQENPRR